MEKLEGFIVFRRVGSGLEPKEVRKSVQNIKDIFLAFKGAEAGDLIHRLEIKSEAGDKSSETLVFEFSSNMIY